MSDQFLKHIRFTREDSEWIESRAAEEERTQAAVVRRAVKYLREQDEQKAGV